MIFGHMKCGEGHKGTGTISKDAKLCIQILLLM
jgi:hypothetical protein